jgi:hypothetical protein
MSTINPDDLITWEMRAGTPDGRTTSMRFTVEDEKSIEDIIKRIRKMGWTLFFLERKDVCSFDQALKNLDTLDPYPAPVKQ